MVNLALTLALLEPLISSRLITCPDVQYARQVSTFPCA